MSRKPHNIGAVHAVLFDMDGVIFDSERRNLSCWNRAGEAFGLDDAEEVGRACIGGNAEATERIFREHYGGRISFQAFREEAMKYFREAGSPLPVKKGAKELLSFLSSRRIPAALASSTRRELVENELREAGLIAYFDALICGDMVSESKPSPQIFLTAAEAIGMPPASCCVIEDSYNGVRAGHAAGMMTIMVPDLLPPTKEMEEKADFILPDLACVQQLLAGIHPAS